MKLNKYVWHDNTLKKKSMTTDIAALALLIAALVILKYVDMYLAGAVALISFAVEFYSWRIQKKDKALKKKAAKTH